MALPTREQVDKRFTWRLEDLYSSDELWEKEFIEVKNLLPEIKSIRDTIFSSAVSLKEGLDFLTSLECRLERLYSYAHMRRDEDNTVSLYQGMTDRAAQLNVLFNSETSFLTPGLLKLPEQELIYYSGLPEMSDYRQMLRDVNRNRKHILDESAEKILAMADEVAEGPQNIFNMLNHADLKFPVIKNEKGEDIEITHGNYAMLLESQDRNVRKQAFEDLYSTYKSLLNTFSAAYGASVKSDCFYAKARNYPSALEASLFEDKVSPEVYTNLIQSIHDNLPQLARYLKLKKRALGLDELHLYDVYVPLVREADFNIDFEKAKQMVLEGLSPLGSEYALLLSEAFSDRWIDVYENRGKTSGAYSWGAYGTHPYVLMNFQPNIDSVFTLAHELGHTMHSYYSSKNNSFLNAQYKILVAEVASTVNEVLVTKHLLSTLKDSNKKKYILNHFLEGFRTTVFRQTMFAEFERISHRLSEKGEPLTSERLCNEYRQLNTLYYGDVAVIDEQIAYEWARIPHFYNAFYVYKYATGFSSAVAIANRLIKGEGVSDYIEFLKSGGRDYPIELLKIAGVNLEKPKPVNDALKVFGETLSELESLI